MDTKGFMDLRVAWCYGRTRNLGTRLTTCVIKIHIDHTSKELRILSNRVFNRPCRRVEYMTPSVVSPTRTLQEWKPKHSYHTNKALFLPLGGMENWCRRDNLRAILDTHAFAYIHKTKNVKMRVTATTHAESGSRTLTSTDPLVIPLNGWTL